MAYYPAVHDHPLTRSLMRPSNEKVIRMSIQLKRKTAISLALRIEGNDNDHCFHGSNEDWKPNARAGNAMDLPHFCREYLALLAALIDTVWLRRLRVNSCVKWESFS